MGNMHDAFYVMNPSISVAAGSAATTSTGALGAQTRFLQVVFKNTFSTFVDPPAVWYSSENSAVTSVDGALLPPNWVQLLKINPGQALFVRSNTIAASTTVYVTSLTD